MQEGRYAHARERHVLRPCTAHRRTLTTVAATIPSSPYARAQHPPLKSPPFERTVCVRRVGCYSEQAPYTLERNYGGKEGQEVWTEDAEQNTFNEWQNEVIAGVNPITAAQNLGRGGDFKK